MKEKIATIITFIIFSAFIGVNAYTAFEARDGFFYNIEGMTFKDRAEIIAEVEDFTLENVWERYKLIEGYGFVQKILGKKEYNAFDNVIDKDGYIHSGNFYVGMDFSERDIAIQVRLLQDYCKERNTAFTFVITPMKVAQEDARYYGIPYNDFMGQADDVERMLNYYNVDFLDLRDSLAKYNLTYEESYYRTDHHWQTKPAFLGYVDLLNKMEETWGKEVYEKEYTTDCNNYRIVVYDDLMFGSQARRVGGIYGGGAEDFELYLPLKDTHYKVQSGFLRDLSKREGKFSEVIVNEKVDEKIKDKYQDSIYDLSFINGLSSFIRVENVEAETNDKILVIRDSYFSPVGSYMCQNFKQTDLIYMLGENMADVLDLIEKNSYDYVIFEVCPENMTSGNINLFEVPKNE